MKKKIILVIVIFFLTLSESLLAYEIKTLAIVNNKIITNLDLENQIKLIEVLTGAKIKKKQEKFIIEQMIDMQIKKSEVEEKKINFQIKIVTQEVTKILKNVNFENLEINLNERKIIKDILFENIKAQYRWNKLIVSLYGNRISINKDEINEISVDKKLESKDIEKLIEIEKNKKIQIFSKTHFNNIKANSYIIKY